MLRMGERLMTPPGARIALIIMPSRTISIGLYATNRQPEALQCLLISDRKTSQNKTTIWVEKTPGIRKSGGAGVGKLSASHYGGATPQAHL